MAQNRIIKIWRDPYGENFDTTSAENITFSTGVTVLVGCNGAGKTTLLHNIEDEIKNINIPIYKFSDIEESQKMKSKAMFEGNFKFVAASFASSEGENITIRLNKALDMIKQFIKTGKNPNKKNFFGDSENEKENLSTERWILFDSIDSGYSIDNIIILKRLFDLMIKDAKSNDIDLYIVITTNSYELANESRCIDVTSGKEISFNSYEDYKNFVIKTSEIKEKRYKNESNR